MFEHDLAEVRNAAEQAGIPWDDELFEASFGKGTYRWLIGNMGITYIEGMDIGLFELHQNYSREDMRATPSTSDIGKEK